MLAWPLALVALLLYPFLWLLSLPFRLVGISLQAVLDLVGAVIRLPARLLGAGNGAGADAAGAGRGPPAGTWCELLLAPPSSSRPSPPRPASGWCSAGRNRAQHSIVAWAGWPGVAAIAAGALCLGWAFYTSRRQGLWDRPCRLGAPSREAACWSRCSPSRS